jgi:hypothetical protein
MARPKGGKVHHPEWGPGQPWWYGRCRAIAEHVNFMANGGPGTEVTAWQVEQVLMGAAYALNHKLPSETWRAPTRSTGSFSACHATTAVPLKANGATS